MSKLTNTARIEGYKSTALLAMVVAGAAFLPLLAEDLTVNEDLKLTADRTIDGKIIITPGATVDLNGYTLTASGLMAPYDSVVLDDLTEPDPSGVRVTTTNKMWSTCLPQNVFNNNIGYVSSNDNSRRTMIEMAGNMPFVIDYDFGADTPKTVCKYKLHCGPGYYGMGRERAPSAWNFYGSNDKENWTLLDSRTGKTSWTKTTTTIDVLTFRFANSTAYRWYRMEFTEAAQPGNDGMLVIAQLEYFGPDNAALVNSTNDLTEPDPDGDHVFSDNEMWVTCKPQNAFNNVFGYSGSDNTRRVLTFNLPLVIDYDFGENTPKVIGKYNLWCGPGNQALGKERAPSAWNFYGSNDRENWTRLDSQTGQTGWSTGLDVRTFKFANSTAYRWYRMEFTAAAQSGNDGGLMFAQLEYFSPEATITSKKEGQDLTSPDPDGTRVSSPNVMFSTCKPQNAFNNLIGYAGADNTRRTLIDMENNMPFIIDYDFGADEPKTVCKYKLHCGPGASAWGQRRAPSAWNFYGSNDKENWTLLDSRAGQTGWSDSSAIVDVRTFSFVNHTAYRWYRMEFTEAAQPGNDGMLMLGQLEYFSADEIGKLRIDVPAGETVENDSVIVADDVTLVKTGEGTFTATKNGQKYSAGTAVEAGTFKCGAHGDVFGADGNNVSIGPGAILDVNGKFSFTGYPLVMAGGTLKNSGSGVIMMQSFKNVYLTADSTVDLANRYCFMGGAETSTTPVTFLDLGGKTLNVTGSATFDIVCAKVVNGTIEESADHQRLLDVRDGGDLTNGVTFVSNGGFVFYEGPGTAHYLDMLNYTAKYTDCNRGFDNSSPRVRLWGVFKPLSTKYHGLTMQNGSTLDLSEMKQPLPLVSNFVPNVPSLNFADGATVLIKLGNRATSARVPIVSWSAPPANLETLAFECDKAGKGYEIAIKDDGIYVVRHGLTVFVR